MPVLGGLRQEDADHGATRCWSATLAISGVPFFSGFYSKDAILAAALLPGPAPSPQHILLFLLPAVGAAITAFYMFRMWFLVFAGEPRGYPGDGHDGARPRRTATTTTTTATPSTTPTRAGRS